MKTNQTLMMRMLLLVAMLFLAGCEMSPNEQHIQGLWEFANEFGNERSGKAHVFQQWAFDSGTFSFFQEIAMGHPLTLEGRYRIIEDEGEKIGLELYSMQGTHPHGDTMELWITLEEESGGIRIQRTLYVRPK